MAITLPSSPQLSTLKSVLKDASKDGELSDREASSVKTAFKGVIDTLRTEGQVDAARTKVKKVTEHLSIHMALADSFEIGMDVMADRRKGAIAATNTVNREFP